MTGPHVLVLDNYDSFTYNLVQAIGAQGAEVTVKRNDDVDLAGIERLDPDGIVISPGPGNPADPDYFGVCRDALIELGPTTPILGVCLGMQGFVHHYGGEVVQAPRLMHGKSCQVSHDGQGVYVDIDDPFEAGRYHSLLVEEGSLPADIEATASSDEDELMGVRHTEHPIEGVQFHPESILTPAGDDILHNFLETIER
ncbi:aminodeoxychorismate/anthranilate synthase component II [Thermoplasmatales archaeon SW_10_69_26]|nr:MAG: aminodeoxychorismate/anthranilate synthase component II [Thermoplasmatales archaeon SW_10_69_26]